MSRQRSFVYRSTVTVLTCFALSLSAVACGGGSTGPGPEVGESGGLIGSPAPEFTATPVTGEGPTTLKDASGRVVLLDFWGTFCEPCKKSFPKYQELMDQFGGDLVIIAVSLDDEDTKEEKLKEFVSQTGVKFAVVWDKQKTSTKAYNPRKMPTSFVIDKAGIVRHMHAGFETGDETKVGDEVKALLGK